tara:strand:- start:510 stop:755 length:246 start_codon:yes stop_codon:yes gene_type:complete
VETLDTVTQSQRRLGHMTDEQITRLEEAYELASVAYARASESFDLATKSYRAAVMAYDLATGSKDSEMFEGPTTGPNQPAK